MAKLPTLNDIHDAADRLSGLAVSTPLISHPVLDQRSGARILCKIETLQRVGAFKFRGAYNAISQVDRVAFPGGVVACSSGNHAQGVAAAATLCRVPSLIVMPADAPRMKVERTRAFGGEVHFYDRVGEDRDAISRRIATDRRAAIIHPFDDAHVIAGQGTVGLELMRQAGDQGAQIDTVLVPCSGGGLATGIALAVKAAAPDCSVMVVEPDGFDDMQRSLMSGKPEANAQLSGSICDALLAPTPGIITFELAKRLLSGGLTVSDDEVRAAIRFAFSELKLVLEPAGAVALAAILSGKLATQGRTVACVLSGGNIDPEQFAEIICAKDALKR